MYIYYNHIVAWGWKGRGGGRETSTEASRQVCQRCCTDTCGEKRCQGWLLKHACPREGSGNHNHMHGCCTACMIMHSWVQMLIWELVAVLCDGLALLLSNVKNAVLFLLLVRACQRMCISKVRFFMSVVSYCFNQWWQCNYKIHFKLSL